MRSPISLLARLVSGTVSSCTCLTKTPDVLQHDPECKYRLLTEAAVAVSKADEPIPMLLFCPECGAQHIDEPDPARGWENPPHRSHLCRECGTIWRPADVPTMGVAAISTAGQKDSWRPGAAVAAARTPAADGAAEEVDVVIGADALVRESEELFKHWLYWANGEAGATPPVKETQVLLARVAKAIETTPQTSSLQAALLKLRERHALRDHPEQKAELDALRKALETVKHELKAAHEAAKVTKAELDALCREQSRRQAEEQKALEQLGKLSAETEGLKRELEGLRAENGEILSRVQTAGDALISIRALLWTMPRWMVSPDAKMRLLKLCETAERALINQAVPAASTSEAARTSTTSPAVATGGPTKELTKRGRRRSRSKKSG